MIVYIRVVHVVSEPKVVQTGTNLLIIGLDPPNWTWKSTVYFSTFYNGSTLCLSAISKIDGKCIDSYLCTNDT